MGSCTSLPQKLFLSCYFTINLRWTVRMFLALFCNAVTLWAGHRQLFNSVYLSFQETSFTGTKQVTRKMSSAANAKTTVVTSSDHKADNPLSPWHVNAPDKKERKVTLTTELWDENMKQDLQKDVDHEGMLSNEEETPERLNYLHVETVCWKQTGTIGVNCASFISFSTRTHARTHAQRDRQTETDIVSMTKNNNNSNKQKAEAHNTSTCGDKENTL